MNISTRQTIIFYFIYSFAIKFLMLPHFLCMDAGRDGWISAALGCVVELLLLYLVIKLLQSNKKVFISIFLLLFLLQLIITLKQTNFMLESTLYDELNPLLFAVPMLIFGIAFCYIPTRAISRGGELFYILIIAAIGLALLPALNKIDMTEVLPIFEGNILGGLYKNLIYFESAAILLIFKDDIKIQKNFTRNFMSWATIGCLVLVAFVFLYYAIFGPLVVARPLAIIDITQQSAYISQNGRLEWIIVCFWLVLLLIRFGVTFFACFAAIKSLIPRAKTAVVAIPLGVVIYVIHAFVIISIADLHNLINILLPFIAAFYGGVAILCLVYFGAKKS